MDVSVIILAHRAAGLSPAIASVVAQTSSRRLDVVVADCAAEDLAPVLQPWHERFHNPHGKVVLRTVREGSGRPTAALNAALAATHAPFVAFLRAGDYWNRFKLQRQFTAIHDSPTVGLIHTAYRHIDAAGQFVDQGPQALDSPCAGYCLGSLLKKPGVALSSVLVRRKVLDQATREEAHGQPFNPALDAGYDYDMALRIARLARFIFVPQPLTYLAHEPLPLREQRQRLLEEMQTHCGILVDFLAHHADPNDRDADPKLHLQRMLYQRAHDLVAENHRHDAHLICELAREKQLLDENFEQLALTVRPTLLARITDRITSMFSSRNHHPDA